MQGYFGFNQFKKVLVIVIRTYCQLSRDLQFFMVEDIVKFKDLLQNAPLAYKSKYPIFIAKGNFLVCDTTCSLFS